MTDDDLPRIVHAAAARPAGDVPMDAIARRASRRRAWRRSASVVAPLIGVVLTVGLVLMGSPEERVELAPADEPPELPTPDEEPDLPPEADDDEWPEFDVPEAVLTTDGRDIQLLDASSGQVRWKAAAADRDQQVLAVAVRAGSTTDDLTAAFVVSEGQGFGLGYVETRAGGEPTTRTEDRGADYTVGLDADSSSQPWPMWSPDGDALGWVELPPDDGAAPQLRIVPWGDATGEPVTLSLEGLPWTPLRIDAWIEESQPRVEGERSVYITSRDHEEWRVGLVRTGEGWILSGDGIEPSASPRGPLVTTTHDGDVYHGPAYVLYLYVPPPEEEAAARLELIDEVGHQGLPLPDEMQDADLAAIWLVGAGDHVLVGDGERAWITSRPGGLRRPLDVVTVHADWVGTSG